MVPSKRGSLYWDDFAKREKETIQCCLQNKAVPVRRVAVFITEKCNFRCPYCNAPKTTNVMRQSVFEHILERYGDTAIIHITGGEPSLVPWLYRFIDNNSKYRFHLNTNGYIEPPRNIKRLKISFDTCDPEAFNQIAGRRNAFDRVVQHIKSHCSISTVSITCVLSKQTYASTPTLMRFCRKEFPLLYAVFFSVYKGHNPAFQMGPEDVDKFFTEVKPQLEAEMDSESLALFRETIDGKFRLLRGTRFPENDLSEPCYLALSERVFDWQGNEYRCSHLYRDGILQTTSAKHEKCLYGCNGRLVRFNNDVAEKINKERSRQ